jgi:2-keto-4-pentenoate hydratase/2-oxohepta-3-ene-1,7-dioic acid hydratase in catechol pathway
MIVRWARFLEDGREAFGVVDEDNMIAIYDGHMFSGPSPSARTLPLRAVRLLPPTAPTKMIGLWNNFHALAEKLGKAQPEHPLYFLKANSSWCGPDEIIRRPKFYAGRIVYEGELGIVIGRRCREISAGESQDYIFGYTCINDITASDIINEDPSFAQWTRAKSFDGFGAFGPVIATGLTAEELTVRTILNGDERQNFPVSDMIIKPAEMVSRLSHDMTLLPGDIICCGTSLGVGTMKGPRDTVEVTIGGIGTLRNVFVQ